MRCLSAVGPLEAASKARGLGRAAVPAWLPFPASAWGRAGAGGPGEAAPGGVYGAGGSGVGVGGRSCGSRGAPVRSGRSRRAFRAGREVSSGAPEIPPAPRPVFALRAEKGAERLQRPSRACLTQRGRAMSDQVRAPPAPTDRRPPGGAAAGRAGGRRHGGRWRQAPGAREELPAIRPPVPSPPPSSPRPRCRGAALAPL